MTKIVLKPISIDNIKQSLKLCDCFIVGIKNFSINMGFSITIEELKSLIPIIKNENKEIFIAVNKVLHNKDLEEIEQLLKDFEKLNIDGILYSDIAILNLCNKLKISKPLISNQFHLVTNYHTCNFWFNKGIKTSIVSGEITLEEIIEIKKNTDMKLMVPVFGFLLMCTAKRKLISNYFNYLNESKDKDIYYLYEKQKEGNYPIMEDDNGTYILSSFILNGLEELLLLNENNIDYILIDGVNLNGDILLEVLEAFYNVINNYLDKSEVKKLYDNINQKLPFPVDKGFYYKETIYKVKNNE